MRNAPTAADEAAEVLGEIGPPAKAAVPALVDQLQSSRHDPELKTTICQTLGKIGAASPAAVGALRTLVQDEAPDLRQAAAAALRQLGQN